MLLICCDNCLTAVRVIGEENKVNLLVGEFSEFWPDRYTCVACGKHCSVVEEHTVNLDQLAKLKVRDLKPEEMLAALHGLGTPEEMMCDITTVRELLEKKAIKKVHGYTVGGTTRTCITEIEFDDGIKLHLGSSVHGAVVYRIARPISYTEKLLAESNA